MRRAGILAIVGFFAAAVLAQSEGRPPQTPRDRDMPGFRTESSPDTVLAGWLLTDNEKEVAFSEIGVQKATNPEVKAFATKMVQDHRAMISKLQRFSPRISTEPGLGSPGKGNEGAGEGSRPPGGQENPPSGSNPPGSGSNPPGRGMGSEGARGGPPGRGLGDSLDVVGLKKELNDACLASAKKELDAKSGAEFDKCFMMGQVMGHVAAVDTLTVFKNRASPELAQAINEALTTVKGHLEHAKTLAKKLDGDRSGDAHGK